MFIVKLHYVCVFSLWRLYTKFNITDKTYHSRGDVSPFPLKYIFFFIYLCIAFVLLLCLLFFAIYCFFYPHRHTTLATTLELLLKFVYIWLHFRFRFEKRKQTKLHGKKFKLHCLSGCFYFCCSVCQSYLFLSCIQLLRFIEF